MATQRGSIGKNNSDSKPKFGTVFFRPKEDDEEEEDEPSIKGRSFALTRSTFSNLQLFSRGRKADDNTVFVANADGKTGARIVLELLHDGFKVRAGVQDINSAQALAQFASEYAIIDAEETKRLNVVEFSPEETELVAKAIGNASKVVVTIGEGEQGPVDKVTPQEAAQIVEAAALAKVSNLVIVSQLEKSAVTSDGPAGFFAKLFAFFSRKGRGRSSLSYSELVDIIVETDLKYTLLQTSDSDSVSDALSATSAVVIGSENASLGGKVSKLQVASVVSTALSNIATAENKVFEVSASSEASPTPIIDLLSAVDVDDRRQQLAEQRAREAAEEEANKAAEEAMEALQVAAQLEDEAKKLAAEEARAAALAETARARAVAVSASVSELAEEFKAAGGDLSRLSSLRIKSAESAEEEEKGSGGGFDFSAFASKINIPKLNLKLPEREEAEEKPVVAKALPAWREKPAAAAASKKNAPSKPAAVKEAPVAVKQVASKKKGGLFGQETVYMDETDAGDF